MNSIKNKFKINLSIINQNIDNISCSSKSSLNSFNNIIKNVEYCLDSYECSNLFIDLYGKKFIFDFIFFNFESNEDLISFAGEYLDEIYTNLLYDDKELEFKPKLDYMNFQKDINEQMRAILIDWLIEVHFIFRFKSQTLFQTVWIIDTYLTFEKIQRDKLQLLGVASLLISCKSQEIFYPPLNQFIIITDGGYKK